MILSGFLRFLGTILFISFLPLYPIFWITTKLMSHRCPRCNSKWSTELIGEWDGEDWHCRNCDKYWTVK